MVRRLCSASSDPAGRSSGHRLDDAHRVARPYLPALGALIRAVAVRVLAARTTHMQLGNRSEFPGRLTHHHRSVQNRPNTGPDRHIRVLTQRLIHNPPPVTRSMCMTLPTIGKMSSVQSAPGFAWQIPHFRDNASAYLGSALSVIQPLTTPPPTPPPRPFRSGRPEQEAGKKLRDRGGRGIDSIVVGPVPIAVVLELHGSGAGPHNGPPRECVELVDGADFGMDDSSDLVGQVAVIVVAVPAARALPSELPCGAVHPSPITSTPGTPAPQNRSVIVRLTVAPPR